MSMEDAARYLASQFLNSTPGPKQWRFPAEGHGDEVLVQISRVGDRPQTSPPPASEPEPEFRSLVSYGSGSNCPVCRGTGRANVKDIGDAIGRFLK